MKGANQPARTMQRAVLVVEDDDAIREVLRDLLEEEGYTVQDAVDGKEALAILRGDAHGLVVLLDNLLPGMDGADVLAALDDGGETAEADATAGQQTSALARHAYVLITASPQKITPELKARLARLGAPTITKPFDIARLRQAVRQASQRLML